MFMFSFFLKFENFDSAEIETYILSDFLQIESLKQLILNFIEIAVVEKNALQVMGLVTFIIFIIPFSSFFFFYLLFCRLRSMI